MRKTMTALAASALSSAAPLAAGVGTIAVGRYADMIAVSGDALADVSVLLTVPVVIEGGAVVWDAC